MSSKEDLKREASAVRKSCCFFCHQNCGVLAYVKDGKVLAIEGDPEHPVSRGGLCARGNIALQHLNHPARVNVPLKRVGARGSGKWKQVSWDQALDEIAQAGYEGTELGPYGYYPTEAAALNCVMTLSRGETISA